MSPALAELLRGLPPLVASHLELTVVALAAALALAAPLVVATTRWPRLRYPLVTATALVQTVPGLALLALMVPLVAATGGLFVGASSFGFAPAVVALTLYALLPVLRNAVTGVGGVDAAAIEAARGMGMAPRQVLTKVQLPLAAPVIAAGVRTAAVWTVGAATLATPVGQRCLGNYIFAGLQTRRVDMVLVGVVAASALALGVDLALAGVERGLAPRRRRTLVAGLAGLTLLVGAGLAAPRILDGAKLAAPAAAHASAPAAAAPAPRATTIRVGAKTFSEQYILAEVLRQRLEAAGLAVEISDSLGSTVVFDALRRGDLDVYVDYSGTLYAGAMKRTGGGPRWRVLAEVEAYLAGQGVRSLGSLGFENAYALAVRRDTATRLGLRSLVDLRAVAPRLRLGADYEFLGRPEWAAVRDAYGLGFARAASFDPSLLYDSLGGGASDVITVFSSDGRIAADDLVVLEDPRAALPPYDAMLLVGPRVADDARIVCALAPLRGAIGVELMRAANGMVDRQLDKATPAEAARWLLARVALPPPRCAGP